jgi:hypothetical protein
MASFSVQLPSSHSGMRNPWKERNHVINDQI